MITINLHKDTFSCRFGFGDVVYLRLREEKIAGMVTGCFVRPSGGGYYVSWGNNGQEGVHYEFELTDEYDPNY